ncbi:MAG TPA: hypothetical protein P5137_13530 [Candidatus Brocadiia bacterium]|nr:hypothetical protein [Candidatus Brocadiia bacterium]
MVEAIPIELFSADGGAGGVGVVDAVVEHVEAAAEKKLAEAGAGLVVEAEGGEELGAEGLDAAQGDVVDP